MQLIFGYAEVLQSPKGASELYAARKGKTRVPCSGKLSPRVAAKNQ